MVLTRRRLLGTTGASLAAGIAGCLGGGSGGGDGTETPDGLTVETVAVGDLQSETMAVTPAGEVVLLDFFATWCAPCKPQMDHLGEIHGRFPDVHMLSITWESDTDLVTEFWTDHDGTWPVAKDPEVRTGEEFGVDRIPTMLIFDAEGTEVWRHSGLAATDSIAEQLRAAGATETTED
jgi:thiol-disulfide isomerase/thioredoxin